MNSAIADITILCKGDYEEGYTKFYTAEKDIIKEWKKNIDKGYEEVLINNFIMFVNDNSKPKAERSAFNEHNGGITGDVLVSASHLDGGIMHSYKLVNTGLLTYTFNKGDKYFQQFFNCLIE